MARQIRVEFPGAVYHVTIRGNGRQDVFDDDRDRERFIRRLSESVEAYGVRLHLFCLMNTHVHLLLGTPSGNLSRFMQSLETGYTVYYNLRHGTVGHLFQGRYKAKLVEGNEYLLKLSRYVHLNPVQTVARKTHPLRQRIAFLRAYRWSSYPSYIGEEKELAFVAYGPVLAETGAKPQRRQREYRRYVEAGLVAEDADFLEVLNSSSDAVGGAVFLAWVREACANLGGKAAKPEDVSFRRQTPLVSREKVLEVICTHLRVSLADLSERRRHSALRPIAARMLVKYAKLTNRQVAETLGMKSGVSSGQQVRRAAALKEEDRQAAEWIAGIEKALDGEIFSNC